jgi:type IV pilus assembly protein PilB
VAKKMESMKLGEYLVKGGAVAQWQLDIALKKQEKEGGLIGEILINLGYIQDEQLIAALRSQAENRT